MLSILDKSPPVVQSHTHPYRSAGPHSRRSLSKIYPYAREPPIQHLSQSKRDGPCPNLLPFVCRFPSRIQYNLVSEPKILLAIIQNPLFAIHVAFLKVFCHPVPRTTDFSSHRSDPNVSPPTPQKLFDLTVENPHRTAQSDPAIHAFVLRLTQHHNSCLPAQIIEPQTLLWSARTVQLRDPQAAQTNRPVQRTVISPQLSVCVTSASKTRKIEPIVVPLHAGCEPHAESATEHKNISPDCPR